MRVGAEEAQTVDEVAGTDAARNRVNILIAKDLDNVRWAGRHCAYDSVGEM